MTAYLGQVESIEEDGSATNWFFRFDGSGTLPHDNHAYPRLLMEALSPRFRQRVALVNSDVEADPQKLTSVVRHVAGWIHDAYPVPCVPIYVWGVATIENAEDLDWAKQHQEGLFLLVFDLEGVLRAAFDVARELAEGRGEM